MPRLQIRMMNSPTRGIGAFMPSPYAVTTPAASSQGVLRVEGYPGTLQVPSPAPAALNDGELGGPFNQPSLCAPDFILPSAYFARISRLTTGLVPTKSNNVAPVKAPFIARTATQTQYRTRVGGRTVTRWPRQFTRWPNYREVKGNG